MVRHKLTVRKIDPWSVLKLSVIFYFFGLLVFMLGLTLFWAVLNQVGLVQSALQFLADLNIIVRINAGNIARAAFLVGLLGVVLMSGVSVFLCFLYNLVADLVGGLRIITAEDE